MDDTRLKKLRYRAWHRGFVEADLILGPFADTRLAALAPALVDEFERLLDEPDPDLFAWIVGQAQPPATYDGGVLALIQDFRFSAHSAPGQGA